MSKDTCQMVFPSISKDRENRSFHVHSIVAGTWSCSPYNFVTVIIKGDRLVCKYYLTHHLNHQGRIQGVSPGGPGRVWEFFSFVNVCRMVLRALLLKYIFFNPLTGKFFGKVKVAKNTVNKEFYLLASIMVV